MKKTALVLMLIAIFSKILGFARELALSYFYGASNISDAYLISTTIPGTIFAFVGTALATSYIPMYNNILKQKGLALADRFTSNIVNFLFVICTIIVALVLIFAELIVKLFASGFDGDTLSLAVTFTRIGIIGIYFTGLINVFSGFLQIKNNFVIPALIGLPLNIIVIFSIGMSAKLDTTILAIGTAVATACQFLFLIPSIRKKGYRHKFVLDKNDPSMRSLIALALPVMLGLSVNQINTLVDRTVASQLAVGGISALNYANRLNSFVQGLFVLSITTAMYPLISKMAAEQNMDGLKKVLSEAISGVSLLVMPVTVGAMIFAKPIVDLLFGRGAFDAQAVSMTAKALFFFSIGGIGFGLREILSRAFYSLRDTKTPTINAAISMGLNIVLILVLSKFLGIGGLALATSISATVCTGLLFVSLRKKIGPFGLMKMTLNFGKIFIASAFMGVLARISYSTLLTLVNPKLALMFSIGIGATAYFIIIYFMKIEDVDNIITVLKTKLGRGSKLDQAGGFH